MRVVHGPEDVQEAFERASGEAASAFGRPELFCERFVAMAKHLRFNLADRTSRRALLRTRLSVQRSIRKSSSMHFSVTLRMPPATCSYAASLRLANACDYLNAGTVEFLVDAEENVYFIEVNPRIQVEHTVTEVITGGICPESNLVAAGYTGQSEIQINEQDDIQQSGYAIQCRITTEDPLQGFCLIPKDRRIMRRPDLVFASMPVPAVQGWKSALITTA